MKVEAYKRWELFKSNVLAECPLNMRSRKKKGGPAKPDRPEMQPSRLLSAAEGIRR